MPRASTRPTGVVTFLFTDIEGSTRLWDQAPEAMTRAMTRHDELLQSLIDTHDGIVFKHTGDGVCAAFQDGTDALEAALAVQAAFGDENFDGIGRISIRVTLHTGEAEEIEGDYRGQALNRAARLLEVAVGGDILVTDKAAETIRPDLADTIELADLGRRRLRGISRPGHVYLVGESGGEVPRRATAERVSSAASTMVLAAVVTVVALVIGYLVGMLWLAAPPGPGPAQPIPPEPVPTTTIPGPEETAPPPVSGAADTSPAWVNRPGGTLAGLVSHGGVVIAASRSTGLHAYRAGDARPFWPERDLVVDLDQPLVEPFGAPVQGIPAVGQGVVSYSTTLGTLHAVDLNNGQLCGGTV